MRVDVDDTDWNWDGTLIMYQNRPFTGEVEERSPDGIDDRLASYRNNLARFLAL